MTRAMTKSVNANMKERGIDMKSDNCNNKIYTYTYPREGDGSVIDMQLVLKMFRCGFKSIGGIKVDSVMDHSKGADGCPEKARETAPEVSPEKSSIEYCLSGGSSVVIRSSGDEPTLEVKVLIAGNDTENAAADKDPESALEIEKRIREDLESIIYMDNRMGYCCE